MKICKRALKKIDVLDMALTKLSVAIFILFLITIWPAAMIWVQSVNPWYFLIALIIIAARPVYRCYIKK